MNSPMALPTIIRTTARQGIPGLYGAFRGALAAARRRPLPPASVMEVSAPIPGAPSEFPLPYAGLWDSSPAEVRFRPPVLFLFLTPWISWDRWLARLTILVFSSPRLPAAHLLLQGRAPPGFAGNSSLVCRSSFTST